MRRYERRPRAIALLPDRSRSLRLFVLAALALALLLVLAACGGAGADPAPTSVPTRNNDVPSGPLAVALETPDVVISTYQGADRLGGEEVKLSEIVALGRPVVLNFWAALCAPCRAEMPEFERINAARSDEITIVGIDIGPQQFLGSREEGKELLLELGVTYPVGTTFDDKVVRNFEVAGLPTTFFIKADGSLHRSWSGLLTEGKINEIIDEMLAS